MNRSAKSKQRKRDVPREQWLSQGKNKGCKMDLFERGKSPPPSMQTSLEMRSRDGDNEDSSIHQSDSESLVSSSNGRTLDTSDSANLNGRNIDISKEEEDDNGCLDDWEAIADALITNDNQHKPFVSEQSYKYPSGENFQAWRLDDALRPKILPNPSKYQDFPTNREQHCGSDATELACKSFIPQPSPCPICYEDLDATDSRFLPCSCGFRLCLFCHNTILEVDRRCPGCRKKYDCTNGGMSI